MNMHDWMSGLRDLLRGDTRPQPAPSPTRRRRDGRQRRRRALTLLAPPGVDSPIGPGSAVGEPSGRPLPTAMAPARTAPEPLLQLALFGPLRASIGGRVVIDERFTRRKARALLALLYLERGRYVPRDELLERLWSNRGLPLADSGRLKQTVLVLRRALEGQRSRRTGWRYIVELGGAYAFDTRAPHRSDLEEFERELGLAYSDQAEGNADAALAHFQRAFALYRGDLLPEFRYEDWAASEIAGVREHYLRALEDAARLRGARGEYPRAVELLRRVERADPLRESSTRQLMEWLWRTGDRGQALRAYARLRAALASSLQIEPDPAVTALYQAIRRQSAPGGQPGPGLSAAS